MITPNSVHQSRADSGRPGFLADHIGDYEQRTDAFLDLPEMSGVGHRRNYIENTLSIEAGGLPDTFKKPIVSVPILH